MMHLAFRLFVAALFIITFPRTQASHGYSTRPKSTEQAILNDFRPSNQFHILGWLEYLGKTYCEARLLPYAVQVLHLLRRFTNKASMPIVESKLVAVRSAIQTMIDDIIKVDQERILEPGQFLKQAGGGSKGQKLIADLDNIYGLMILGWLPEKRDQGPTGEYLRLASIAKELLKSKTKNRLAKRMRLVVEMVQFDRDHPLNCSPLWPPEQSCDLSPEQKLAIMDFVRFLESGEGQNSDPTCKNSMLKGINIDDVQCASLLIAGGHPQAEKAIQGIDNELQKGKLLTCLRGAREGRCAEYEALRRLHAQSLGDQNSRNRWISLEESCELEQAAKKWRESCPVRLSDNFETPLVKLVIEDLKNKVGHLERLFWAYIYSQNCGDANHPFKKLASLIAQNSADKDNTHLLGMKRAMEQCRVIKGLSGWLRKNSEFGGKVLKNLGSDYEEAGKQAAILRSKLKNKRQAKNLELFMLVYGNPQMWGQSQHVQKSLPGLVGLILNDHERNLRMLRQASAIVSAQKTHHALQASLPKSKLTAEDWMSVAYLNGESAILHTPAAITNDVLRKDPVLLVMDRFCRVNRYTFHLQAESLEEEIRRTFKRLSEPQRSAAKEMIRSIELVERATIKNYPSELHEGPFKLIFGYANVFEDLPALPGDANQDQLETVGKQTMDTATSSPARPLKKPQGTETPRIPKAEQDKEEVAESIE